MSGKPVSHSAIRDQCYKLFPNDLNSNGTVFGGLVMAEVDRVAAIVAARHAGAVCVTASIDGLHFHRPAYAGDVLILQGSVNRTWRTSLEVGVKVWAEDVTGSARRHIVTAYLTFVAVDKDMKPKAVPEVLPETAAEQRRYQDALRRRELRMEERKVQCTLDRRPQ